MERADTRWQLVLRTVFRARRRWLPVFGLVMGGAGAILEAAPQSFAVALPGMEGPVTMAIFSREGKRVRLLHRDAAVETIPAGLNGLIMTWDGKDDRGIDVPAGTYRARGLVHGPIRSSALPAVSPRAFRSDGEESLWQYHPFPPNRITLRAAEDELLETRPLLAIGAVSRSDAIDLEAEGLPLVTISVDPGKDPAAVHLNHGGREGTALLSVGRGRCDETFTVTGLDRIVPLEAGTLEVSAKAPADTTDASHPAPIAGESGP